MKTTENKAQKKLIEIVLYMAGILMYHVNIFGINNLNDLNKKICEHGYKMSCPHGCL